jgi:hypothetical protein
MIVAIIPMVLTAACTAPSTKSAAELEITTFEMKYLKVELQVYVYAPEITLTEKTGQSAAQIAKIDFQLPDGQNAPGGTNVCPDEMLTVPAGGAWKLTDLPYLCRDVDSPTDISGKPVTVTVLYADKNGVPGIVRRTAPAGSVR